MESVPGIEVGVKARRWWMADAHASLAAAGRVEALGVQPMPNSPDVQDVVEPEADRRSERQQVGVDPVHGAVDVAVDVAGRAQSAGRPIASARSASFPCLLQPPEPSSVARGPGKAGASPGDRRTTMTKAERTAAARLRHEELVEILTGAVFDLYLRDRVRSSGRLRRGPASGPIREAGHLGPGGAEMVTWPAA